MLATIQSGGTGINLNGTITVSGASPVVDLTTTRGGSTIASDVLVKELRSLGLNVELNQEAQ